MTREPLWGALTIPEGSCVPISWDQGVELHDRKQVRPEPTKLSTSATRTSRGRGTNEDTNGLLWQYFQPGHRQSVHSAPGLDLGIRRAQRPVTYRVGFPNRSNRQDRSFWR